MCDFITLISLDISFLCYYYTILSPAFTLYLCVYTIIFFPLVGKFLSMGYGFVEYKKKKFAAKAMKTLQHATLDGHQLELKVSNRDTLKR